MATTDHPESVHDDVGTPVEVQARDEQMVSGEVHGVEPDVRRASEERTLRVDCCPATHRRGFRRGAAAGARACTTPAPSIHN